jgi:hypothetical protein
MTPRRVSRASTRLSLVTFAYAALLIAVGVGILLCGMFIARQLLTPGHHGGMFGADRLLGSGALMVVGVINVLWGIVVGLSGLLIRVRILRLVSCGIGLLSLLAFPVGTMFGIYALTVLMHPAVRSIYR